MIKVQKNHPDIYNDEARQSQGERCTREIYQTLGIKCWISQWSHDLPLKFDVSDDENWIEVPRTINNAVQYELELPKK